MGLKELYFPFANVPDHLVFADTGYYDSKYKKALQALQFTHLLGRLM